MADNDTESPTVALIHGAFADAGSWAEATELLLAEGVKVQAFVNPLRGPATDSAYVASALAQIAGPVLAVGHSYGGAILTNAATTVPNVVGLAYVSGFAPDENESLGEVEGTSRDSALGPALVPAQVSHRIRRRDGHRALRQPGGLLRGVCPRPARTAGRGAGCLPTAGRRIRVRREVRSPRVEDTPVVGGRRER